jgi:phosphohistidine swiveling domain-containing protein
MGSGGTHWFIEGTIDPRWPVNTRGNIGEVFPEVLTALTYELSVPTAERGWRKAYAEIGILRKGDFDDVDSPVIVGLYGGYGYLNLSYIRMVGVRSPGSSAKAIDMSFFGEGDAPPYVPQKGDKSLLASARIVRSVLKALNQKRLPVAVADSFALAAAFNARRPALDAPDDVLLAYLYEMSTVFERPFVNHMATSALASVVAGVLAESCAAAGCPELLTELVGAAGHVQSAQYSRDLYAIAKLVRADATLTAEFDAGVGGVLDRLTGKPDAAEFSARFAAFLAEHGHRGPNDWELSARTWDSDPELALIAVDRMRLADYDLAPETRLGDDDAKRAAAIAAVRPHLKRLARINFDKAVKAMPFWAQAREATRDRAVRVTWPIKQVYRELVRRGADRGGHPDPVMVALLSPRSELPSYLKDPSAFADVITERGALHARFSAVEARFFITSQSEVPSIEELEADQAVSHVAPAVAGDVLTGNAGSSGIARGRVRVVHDPADAYDLMPGEVLVAPLTDPAWTPLFLPAAAVVVNVGALMSHAVTVSRELGIPCVVSVSEATRRLVDGMEVEVDGGRGTVTVLAAASA